MKNKKIQEYANSIYEQEIILQKNESKEDVRKAKNKIIEITSLFENDFDALMKVNQILEKKFFDFQKKL